MKINYFDSIDLEKLYPEYGRYILSNQDPNDYMGFGYWFNQGSVSVDEINMIGSKSVNCYIRGNIDNLGMSPSGTQRNYGESLTTGATIFDRNNFALCGKVISSVTTTEEDFEVSYDSKNSTISLKKNFLETGEYRIPLIFTTFDGKEKTLYYNLSVLKSSGGVV